MYLQSIEEGSSGEDGTSEGGTVAVQTVEMDPANEIVLGIKGDEEVPQPSL